MLATASEIVRLHHSLDPVSYLADASFVPYWLIVFRRLISEFCAVDTVQKLPPQPMLLMQRLDSIIDSLPAVDELKRVVPIQAVAVVERKLGEVISFLASADVHFRIAHNYSTSHGTP